MTLRTITSPYDNETLTEIRNRVATKIGIAYANWDPNFATAVNRYIDASAEYLAERFPDAWWLMQEESLSLASGTATLSLSSAARSVIIIIETYDGSTRTVKPATKRGFYEAWGAGATTHPWNSQTEPHWLIDGVTSDNPPKIQLKRVPTPDAAVTGTALCRPYMTLRDTTGDASYTHIPANAAEALFEYVMSKVHAYRSEYDKAQFHKGALEDEIRTLQIGNDPEGGMEAARIVDAPDDFYSEMAGP